MIRTVVLAGGGTGGHLTPAMALANVWRQQNIAMTLITGQRDLEQHLAKQIAGKHVYLNVQGFVARGIKNQLMAFCLMCIAFVKAIRLLWQLKPQLVVLTGGYVALPVGLAAAVLRQNMVLVEPNAIYGRVTKLLLRFANVLIAPSRPPKKFFGQQIMAIPVRDAIVALGQVQKNAGQTEKLTAIVLGGSQGAKTLNETMPMLASQCPNLEFIHIAGPNQGKSVEKNYQKFNVQAQVFDFCDDMAALYAKADFMIARAGAATLAEVVATRIPTIFVPYPYAADNHQMANAALLTDQGAAVLIEEGEGFAQRLNVAITQMQGLTTRQNIRLALSNVAMDVAAEKIIRQIESALQ